MKKIILLLAVVFSLPALTQAKDLYLSGFFINESNVKYEVCILNNDDSCIKIDTKTKLFSYKIKLKIGNKYVIRFMKDGVTKELYIDADVPGIMELDVDFKSNSAAKVCYNKEADDYSLTLLYNNKL
jgi:hypothetical protein